MTSLKPHPAAELLPKMSDEEFRGLVEDIRVRGLLQEIVVYESQVLDGRHRLLACSEAGVEPRAVEWDGRDSNGAPCSPFRYVWSLNGQRRDMSQGQKVAVFLKVREADDAWQAEQDRMRERANKARRKGLKRGSEPPPVAGNVARDGNKGAKSKRGGKHKTRKKIAAATGVSERTAQDVLSVKAKDEALFEQVVAGKVTAPQAKKKLKERAREERRAANRAKVQATAKAEERPKVSIARYATIVADPPWSPEAAGVVDVVGRSNPTYATMGVDEIAALMVDGKPVAELADDDAHLYLWATNRTLRDAYRVLEAWGFRFVTLLTWCKPTIGIGNYYRNNTEHVLFGVKGQQRLKRADVGTWFKARRGPDGHSSKPGEFYELVDTCSPGPVLELFGRRPRAGWTVWGEGL